MARKRGSSSSADAAGPAPKQGRGGGGRGQGRKRAAPVLGRDFWHVQQSIAIGDVLGVRQVASERSSGESSTKRGAAAAPGAVIEWYYNRYDGGEEDSLVPQKQRIGGAVRYGRYESAMWQAAALDRGAHICRAHRRR
jgi:hypothetical protein